MKLIQGSLILLLCWGLQGCSGAAKHPLQASTLDVLFGDNVQRYLADRRQTLLQLEHRAGALDHDILLKLGQLHKLETQLSQAKQRAAPSEHEINRLRAQVAEQRANAELSLRKLDSVKATIDAKQAQATVLQSNLDADQQSLTQLDQQVAGLEQEVAILDRAIVRTLNLKAEQLLREQGR